MPYITSIEQIGYERGVTEGAQRGAQQGREEEKRSIALNLIQQGIALETIAQATGLSIAQLQQLQSNA